MPLPFISDTPQEVDSTRVYGITVTPADGSSVAGVFTGAEDLVARIWPGGSAAVLATPAATWLDFSAGSLQVAVQPSDLAAIPFGGGTYRLDVSIGSIRLWRGRIKFRDSVGTATLPASYVADRDLLDYLPSLEDLLSEADEAGFARQCARATSKLKEVILSRWKTGNYAPTIGQPGYGSWMMYGGASDAPESAWLRGVLDAGGLIIRPKTIEICAKWAIAFVCDWQYAATGEDKLLKMAVRFRKQANNLLKTYRAEINTDNDQGGIADLVVNCGATNLR